MGTLFQPYGSKTVSFYVLLKRISIGSLVIDESLKKGEYRNLTKDEINSLYDNNN